MQLVLVGVNYKSAGLAAREPLSFDTPTRQQLLAELKQSAPIEELVLLSTCNRTEVYAIAAKPAEARAAIVATLCAHSGLSVRELDELAYTFYNKFAATHLFEVASGLDSMVLGENEILRQVKRALDDAQAAEVSGPVLNQLLRFAITAGKRVRSETGINEGCASMGALAARLIRQTLAPGARLLVLGAGEIARVLLRNLDQAEFSLTLANRSAEHAQALAADYAGAVEVIGLESLAAALPTADAVVACTAASEYLIHPAQLSARQRPLLLVDLAVPRNIEPACGELTAVSLYDVDGLQQLIQLSLEQRARHVGQAQTIIAEEATRFLEWFHSRDLVPTIRSLTGMFEEVRQREIARGLQKYRDELTPASEELIDRITKAVTQKLLHYPIVKLKTASPADKRIYEQALSELFALDAVDGIDRYLHLPKHTPQQSSQISAQSSRRPAEHP